MSIVATCPDSKAIYFIGREGSLYIRETCGDIKQLIELSGNRIVSVQSCGKFVFAVGQNGSVYVWKCYTEGYVIFPTSLWVEQLICSNNNETGDCHVIVLTDQRYMCSFNVYWPDDNAEITLHNIDKIKLGSMTRIGSKFVDIKKEADVITVLTSYGMVYRVWSIDHSTHACEHTTLPFIVDFSPWFDGKTYIGLTDKGKIIDRKGNQIYVDPTFGTPIALGKEYVLTSSGTILALNGDKFDTPMISKKFIVDMYQTQTGTLFLDEDGNLHRVDGKSLEMVNGIPALVPSLLKYSLPWSIPFHHRLSIRVQNEVMMLMRARYDQESICGLLPREILYTIFSYL